MRSATHKLFEVKDRIPHFAEVTVQLQAGSGRISVSSEAFSWLREEHGPRTAISGYGYDDFRIKAQRGAAFAISALGSTSSYPDVEVSRIVFSNVDTSSDDVALATCRAVWDALGMEYRNHPGLGDTWPE
ncbi:MAG TPA: hypothetical protein VLA09_13790 [Longimicrobiales bacterium]|nr:hypothetical protein [Longimicrobiales bacterium]